MYIFIVEPHFVAIYNAFFELVTVVELLTGEEQFMVQKEVEVTRGKVRSARRMVELVPGHVVSRCCLRTGIVENESQLLSHKRRDFQQFVPYKTSTKN